MKATADFVCNLSSPPTGAEAATEVPDAVQAELLGAGVGVGTFLKLLPEIMALVKLFTSGTATVSEVVAAVLALIAKLKPAS